MSCIYCLCRVGINYELVADCVGCGHGFSKRATYLGIENYEHVFRIHPKEKCPDCGIDHSFVHIPCGEAGVFDVTKEFKTLVDKNPGSYWKGY